MNEESPNTAAHHPNPPAPSSSFTAREVAVLVENLQAGFRTLGEVMAPIPDRLSSVEERLGAVETEVRTLRDVIRLEVPAIRSRLTSLETQAR